MQKLSAYIAQAPRRPLPAAVIERTKHHVLDTLAAMVSGSRLLPGTKAISHVKTLGGVKEASVAGSRIELHGDDALTRAMPSRQGIVEIRMRDGRILRHHTKAVRGTVENPMTRAEVDTKAYDLIAPMTGKLRARKLCEAIWTVEKLDDVRKLRPLLGV